ncbi:MAG: tetratricopeptide repeat protein, partial [bacterium]
NLRIKSLADGGARVRVLDLDRLFSSRADGGIPGDDLFLDYCHFNGEGARLAAGAVLKEIDAVLGLDLPLEQLASSIREDRAGENITRDQKAHLVYARALALHNAGRLDEAEDYYRQVVGLDPGFAEAYSNLGAILLDQGQIREAEVSLRAALERDPRDVAAHYNLGQVLAVKGDLSGARSLFAAGRELDPENASFYQALGQLALLAGDFGQAVGHYEDALRLGRNNLSLRTGLARAFLGMGQVEKARSEAVRVLSLDPGNREALEVLHSSGSERKDGE